MTKIIAIINYKGGVGKTSVSFNLGAALQRQGKKVLLVDLDGQAALTFAALGPEPGQVSKTLYDFLLYEAPPDIQIIEPGFDIIPGSLKLNEIEHKRIYDKDKLLGRALSNIKGYDFMLIDTPPALNIFTLITLRAASAVYIIVAADFLSIRSLAAVLEAVRALKIRAEKGIILNLFDRRRNIEKDLFKTLKKDYRGIVFNTPLRRSVLIPESIILHKNIFQYRKNSPVAKDFESLAREVIRRNKK